MERATKICPRCGGSGRIADEFVIGKQMSQLRKDKGISLQEVARRLKFSAAYICDLEKGRRLWRHELIEKYKAALA